MKVLQLKNFRVIFILLIGISLIKCKKEKKEIEPTGDIHAQLKKEIIQNYATVVYENYNDALIAAKQLKVAIDAFITQPSTASHNAAKQAWLKAREPYGQTEAFRFSQGPVDAVDGPEGLLNAWPLDENYIDYTRDNPRAGIINDSIKYPNINEALLESLNEATGEKNISTGYHAIEFLLWGQDDLRVDLKTPGKRPFTDYIEGSNGTATHQKRRGLYLSVTTNLLIKHLEFLVNQWNPKVPGNYRSTFLSLESDKAIQNLLSGIGILSKGELAGERMFVALTNKDQEDEHSCFSDNTHRDIFLNALGIYNVYFGTYKKLDGKLIVGSSLHELVQRISPETAKKIKVQMEQSIGNILKIPIPFDHALTLEDVGGKGPIKLSVLSLQTQGDLIAQAAKDLGVPISTDIPE